MNLEGIFAIACTPYLEDLTLDFASLEKEVDFILAGGAQGVAYPIMASEFFVLSDEERKKAVELVIRRAQGRKPVAIGVTGVNIHHTIRLAKHAQDAGADALICMTPLQHALDTRRKIDFFRRLDHAVSLPIMLQNVAAYGTAPLEIDEVVALMRDSNNIRYLKEEVDPPIHRIVEAVRKGQGVIAGVFGGWGGLQLLDDLRAGACGNLPACQFVDVLGAIYKLWVSGRSSDSEDLFRRLLPAIIYESKLSLAFSLAVLKRRGIIRHDLLRSRNTRLTAFDHVRIDAYLEEFSDMLVHV